MELAVQILKIFFFYIWLAVQIMEIRVMYYYLPVQILEIRRLLNLAKEKMEIRHMYI